MIKTSLTDVATGRQAQIADTPFGSVLATIPTDKVYSVFKSGTRTTISAAKVAGNLTIRFTDGTETVNLYIVPLTDAPASFSVSFAGKWMGWRDARIEMVTSIDGAAIVSVGYTKIPSAHTLSYAEWDAAR
jgi:hypothetical protein